MRTIRHFIGDPSFHIGAVVALLIYLSQAGILAPGSMASSKLVECRACRRHYYPERPCPCPARREVARLLR